jgi:hypothetical protein
VGTERQRALAVGTWLAGLALIVQMLLPAILSVEARLAEADQLPGVVTGNCSMKTGKTPPVQHHRGCPICLAVAASITAPVPPAPIVGGPAVRPILLADIAQAIPVWNEPLRYYRARAPPITL